MKNNLLMFYKFLLLAQTASDNGKFRKYGGHNATKAINLNYQIKAEYIKQAIGYAQKNETITIFKDFDIQKKLLTITFEFLWENQTVQVSFHSKSEFPKIPWITSNQKWNGIIGMPRKICNNINKKLNLQIR